MIKYLFLFLLIPNIVWGANQYVRQGASGSANGSDWTNAYTNLPATLTRGDTYYIADGSYNSYTFDDTESGSTYIYIKKAIESDHGTTTGWSSAYGDGSAAFDSFIFTKGYYEIDGQTGGGSDSWDFGYGFRVREESDSATKLIRFNAAVSNITFSHIDISYDYNDGLPFPASAYPNLSQDAVYSVYSASYITFSYIRFNKAGRTALLSRSIWDNITIEYSYFKDCTIRTGAIHGEIWSANHISASTFTNITLRYNLIRNFVSTGGFIMSGADGVYIYGNVFHHTVTPTEANGVISNWSAEAVSTNVYIYNNTFANTDATIGYGNTSGWVTYNNLFYNNARVFLGDTHAYNWFYGEGTSYSSETGYQAGSGDPFVNSASYDYHLSSATNAGTTLASTYTTDPDGNTRGVDGTWDRGAYEYGGGSLLTISKAGTGAGTVTSGETPTPYINCGGTCSYAYDLDTVVTLTANPSAGSTFTSWGGDADCSDGEVTMDTSEDCTAVFRNTLKWGKILRRWFGL